MTAKLISKVLEIKNCKKDDFLEKLYDAKLWEIISPVKSIEAKFSAPNVLYSRVEDEIINVGNVLRIPIELEGDLVFIDKGIDGSKGNLIEFNVRNNKDVTKLEGNLRVKALSQDKTKIGIFIHNFELSSDFMNLVGKSVAEITLRTKISEMLRNLENYCRKSSLKNL